MVITKHSFLIMVVHTTITAIYIYIYNCNEVSCMYLLLCAIYQN